jgi:ubiquinone/menaquinone biosynthesis C-methylase UbiE
MTHEQAVSFIKSAVTDTEIQYWADLGCGTGTFTKALIDLLPEGSHVTAVDKEKQKFNLENIDFIQADFTGLDLAELDGILIANALHYVADKVSLLKKLEPMFSQAPRFVIIEYDTDKPNLWVPYPITFAKLQTLFEGLGYTHIEKLNERRSAYGSGNMFYALI